MKKTSFHFRKQRGQSLMEMGIFLMLLLWLLAAAVDFGIGYFSFTTIRDAAQEGAVYAATHSSDSTGIIYRVRHYADDPAHPGNHPIPVDLWDTSKVVVTVGNVGNSPGLPITVTVVYNYDLTLPFLSTIIGRNTIPLRAAATAVILKGP